ncbi:hypothetical protein ACAH01_13035 [Halomicrobium sp. HM KBTZ05]|uniref:hypothetical protein n=1 Tax=Halomicrobium sp. HM KBTZ05 TaxID=3242663 RepID=UPI003558D590
METISDGYDTSSPPSNIDTAYGNSPEDAIVSVIQQHPAFHPDSENKYLTDRPEYVGATPSFLNEFDLNDESNSAGEKSPKVTIDWGYFTGNYVYISIQNIWLDLMYDDGDRAEVKFTASIAIPESLLESSNTAPTGVYQWEAERISTEPKSF